MLFLDILNIKTSFLNHPVGEWKNLEDYDSAKHLVKSLQVTNDCSEHAIKLCTDFLHCAKSEQKLQQVYQVIDDCRKKGSNDVE